LDPLFFPSAADAAANKAGPEHLKHMVMRWENYIDRNVFNLSVPVGTALGGGLSGAAAHAKFWTSPWPYWNMKDHAPELFNSLKESHLVIFKVRGGLTPAD